MNWFYYRDRPNSFTNPKTTGARAVLDDIRTRPTIILNLPEINPDLTDFSFGLGTGPVFWSRKRDGKHIDAIL